MELGMTEIMSVGISIMVIIITITAIVLFAGEPSYMNADVVMWPR